MKNRLPEKYRKSGTLYRGVAGTEEIRNLLASGKSIETDAVDSWSESKGIAEGFMFDNGYPFGYLFKYEPALKDVIVNIQSVHDVLRGFEQQCTEQYDEREVILAKVVLTKENLVRYKENVHYDGKPRRDTMQVQAQYPLSTSQPHVNDRRSYHRRDHRGSS